VIAAGKAAAAMAGVAVRLLGARIRGGLVVTATAGAAPAPLEGMVGGHPLPTADSERAGRRALAIAGSLAADETLLVLISGGASALMAVPAEGITLDDKRSTTAQLLLGGADIDALNTVRKHLSAIKGGWLAAGSAGPSRTFAVSDVVGDDPSVIASGPTVGDATTFAEAIEVVRRFGGAGAYPPPVLAHLEAGARGARPETPKPGDARLSRAASRIIGGRRDAMDGAAREAGSRGYHVVRVDDPVIGEARVAAVSHFRAAVAHAAGAGRPACVVSSGETTVRVTGRGRGGRNQELALALAAPLSSLGVAAAAASVGTDGIDGPTDAAGAIVDSTTIERAAQAAIGAPSRFLDDNNAYAFFDAMGDLIRTGRSDTNVGDLQVILLT
jgi:glycerate 2-kinase